MLTRLPNTIRTLRRRPLGLAIAAVLVLLATAGGGWFARQYFWIEGPLRRAQEASAKHQLLAAKQHLAVGLERSPRHPEMLFLAARVARRLGELDAAVDLLLRCDRSPPADAEALKLENMLVDVQRRGVRTDVESHLHGLSETYPRERALIYEALAQGYMNPRALRPPSAKMWLDKSLDEMPDNPVALRLRGAVKIAMTKFIDATFDYRRAFELDPDNEPGLLGLADSLYQAGNYPQALPLFERLIERRPDDPTVLVGLAGCRASTGEVEEARRILDELLAKEPRNAVALMERGRLALELDQPADAEAWLRKALALDSSDRRTNHLLYQALRLQGKQEEAKEQLAKSQRVFADLRRYGEILTETMNQRPNDPDLHHELGVLMLRNGQPQRGLYWLERALELNPMHRLTHQTLAEYYEKSGLPDRAARHRDKLQ